MITEEQLKKFQELYRRHFGKEISREQAYEEGVKLVQGMKRIYKPMTQPEFEKVQERRKEIKT